MTNAILLYNPAAGRAPLSQARLQKLLERLREGGICCEPVMVPPDLKKSPRLDLCHKNLLIVYGGDGTIHHAIQQAAQTDTCLGLLPAGTANVLAQELGIPLDLDRALDIVLHGARRRIPLGCSGDRYFHLMAGIGLDACVIGQLNTRLKRVLGEAAYWVAGLRTFLRYRPPALYVHLGDETLQGTFAVVANARTYGGHLQITPEAGLDSPELEVCVFTSRRKLRFLWYLWGALRGDLHRYPDVVYRKARSLRITGLDLPIQMDGEIVGRLPADFSIFTPGIQVLVPTDHSPVVDSCA